MKVRLDGEDLGKIWRGGRGAMNVKPYNLGLHNPAAAREDG